MLKIIETPRDGIQGIKKFIPTKKKVEYINQLLKVGFDTVEVGSFVSKKAIPQLKDTDDVLKKLDLSDSHSKIMVLVGNMRGAKEAMKNDAIDHLSFPFSFSKTFLQKNLNTDLEKGFQTVEQLFNLSMESGKELIVYLSMGFGNPYGDEWNMEMVEYWTGKLYDLGLRTIPLSDITGEAGTERIESVFTRLIEKFPKAEFGFHLHAPRGEWKPKVDAAFNAGIRRFDTVVGGLGGCPMTGKEMLSNLDAVSLIEYLSKKEVSHHLDLKELFQASKLAREIKAYGEDENATK